jgi:SecD/SecF fusion protein
LPFKALGFVGVPSTTTLTKNSLSGEDVSFNTPLDASTAIYNKNHMYIDKAAFEKTIFKFSALLGSIIGLVALILIIGIIVSILYKIPGLYAAAYMFTAFSVSFTILVAVNYVISFGLILGLTASIIMSAFCAFNLFERIRKHTIQNNNFPAGIKNGLKSSI